ncbi:MAG: beta-lactamase induction protein [Mizugakiibacter sp.]|uniref:beta-lactamase induction protein n=1 Tax=Mizugakiibacter sp. TaxID=1972610 RepID=UPI0031BF1102|nr:beta-lactamase induction protein [Xanthomonadaceae bacterium]
MATKLVAALIALVLVSALPDLARRRDFGWFRAWSARLGGIGGPLRIALAVLLPALLCALLMLGLQHALFGLGGLAFALLVLLYTLGPRELEPDIDAVLHAPDLPQREAAAQALRPDESSPLLAFDAPSLVEATVLSALKRRFGVLFWFFLLGPAGALLYRLAQLAAAPDDALDEAARGFARRAAAALDWIPAHLMALAMALAADFDAVVRAWRAWHAEAGRSPWEFECGFLGAIARAGVDADVVAGDGYAHDTHDPLGELEDARHLLLRVLVVWLAVVAVIVLAGWFA